MALRAVLATGTRLAACDARSAARSFAGFHTSAVSLGFGSHASDNDPHTLEKEKQRNLSDAGKTKHVMPDLEEGWNEKLASDSEAAVKAERHVDGNETIEDLQHKSVRHIRHQHHEEEELVETEAKKP